MARTIPDFAIRKEKNEWAVEKPWQYNETIARFQKLHFIWSFPPHLARNSYKVVEYKIKCQDWISADSCFIKRYFESSQGTAYSVRTAQVYFSTFSSWNRGDSRLINKEVWIWIKTLYDLFPRFYLQNKFFNQTCANHMQAHLKENHALFFLWWCFRRILMQRLNLNCFQI